MNDIDESSEGWAILSAAASQIVTLEDYRPHSAGLVACTECGRRWTAVAPVAVKVFECPDCGKMYGYPEEEGRGD